MQPFFSTLSDHFSSYIVQHGILPIMSISTNSRNLQEGALFVPLVGENFDAHQFIPDIISKVSAIVISKEVNIEIPKNITVFKVKNTLDFYQELAQYYISTKKDLIKIAITGSAGKTSTKEWLYLLLSQQNSVYKTFSNLNNQVGVPQSILEIQNENIAILELGTGKKGDIQKLTNIIKPNISIVTNIGEAHIEYFETLDNIALEKAYICLPTNDSCYVQEGVYQYQKYFTNFININPKIIFEKIISLKENGYTLVLDGYTWNFPFYGEHNLKNIAMATYIAIQLGISAKTITSTIFPPLPSYRSKIINKNKSKLILDCYNANPLSMKESLKSISQFTQLPILVLGDMLELGSNSKILHQKLGVILNSYNFPLVIFVGKEMQWAQKEYKNKSEWFATIEESKNTLLQLLESENLFFVKASRGMHLENIENF